ncbi:MAG: hypothetical protein WCQ47_06710 [bacterium]
MLTIIFLFSSILLSTNASTPKDIAKYKSQVEYKQALVEYNTHNYEEALKHVESSLSFYSSNKKSKELLIKLRTTGEEYYKTGVSLEHFDKNLALEYLETAKKLLKDSDKKTKEKISAALENINEKE